MTSAKDRTVYCDGDDPRDPSTKFSLSEPVFAPHGPVGSRQAMQMLRPVKERLLQALCLEISGLVLALPLLSYFSDGSPLDNAVLLAVLSLVVMLWSAAHNTLFDTADLHLSGRVASERPQTWRIIHAISHEVSSILVSLPVLIWIAGMDFQTALIVDLWLAALYAFWAWAFYLTWDRMRPLRATISSEGVGAEP
jgi:uncharacterized membrane protein